MPWLTSLGRLRHVRAETQAPKIFVSASEVTFDVPFLSVGGAAAALQVTSTVFAPWLPSGGRAVYRRSARFLLRFRRTVGCRVFAVGKLQGDTVVLFATGFGRQPATGTAPAGRKPGSRRRYRHHDY